MIIKNGKTISSIYKGSQVIDKIMKGTLVVYESFKNLIASGVSPLKLLNCKGVDLLDYKIYGNSVQTRLPIEYQEVEYLENQKHQYIDTGAIPTNNTSVDITYQAIDYEASQYIIGTRGTLVDYAVNGSINGSDWDIRFNHSPIYSNITRSSNKMRTQISMINGNGTWILTDLDINETNSYEISNAKVSATNSLKLFAYSSSFIHNNLRVYSCKIYEGETLIRDFIPCYRKSDNVIGLYDLVENKFYTNIGSGTFIKGSNVPTPTAPIEIESVGDKTKNLVDWDYLLTNSIISKVENGYYAENYSTSVVGIAEHLKEVLKPNVTYTLSRVYEGETNASNGMIAIRIADTSGVVSTTTLVSFGAGLRCGTFSLTQEQIDGIQRLQFYFNTNGATISELQLVEGEYTTDTMPDYEPYGYKIPVKASANIYNYEDFLSTPSGRSGVSKIDYDSINIKHWYQNIFDIPNTLFKPNTTYEISKKINIISGTKNTVESRFVLASTTGTTIKMIDGNQEKNTFTTPADLTTYTRLWVYGMMGDGEIEINDIVIKEQGKEDITTNIYLKEPLRKMDIYADYIDFENSKVVRVIKPSQINGNSSFGKFGAVTNYSAFYMENREMVKSDQLINLEILSNKFRYYKCGTANTNASWSGYYQIGTAITSSYKRICFTLPNTITDTTSAKEWLAENPVNYYYPIATPIEETIELPNIPTFKGTTILSVDTNIQPSNVEVVYKGKE